MKITMSIFLSFVLGLGVLLAGKPNQVTKTSDTPLDLKHEVTAYYLQLLETDPNVQKQLARLTALSKEKNAGLFKLSDEPQAFEWFPANESRTESGDTVHGHFLVVQTAGRWRTKDSDTDMARVADFKVDYDETTPSGTTLTMTFLGFRKLTLTPISAGK